MKLAVSAVILLLCFSIASCAVEFRSGENLSMDQPINDDVVLAGGMINTSGRIAGDMLAAGGTVILQSPVGNNLDVAGGNITIGETVGHSLRAAGGTVIVNSRVTSNAFLFGGTVNLSKDASVGRDLVIGAGTATIAGPVQGKLVGGGGNISISGPVNGDVILNTDRLELLPGAVIRGDLTYTSPNNARISPGARVEGRVIHRKPPREKRRPSGFPVLGWFFNLAMFLLIGGVLFVLAPRGTMSAAGLIRNWPMSLLVGLIALIVIPIAAVIVMVTIIGLPIGIVALVLYGFFLLAGISIAGLTLGRWLLQLITKSAEPNIFLAWLLGLVILLLVFLIPFLGGLAKLAALLIGFGALLRAIWLGWRNMRTAGTV